MNGTIHNLSISQYVARRNTTLLVLSPFEPLFGEQNSDSIAAKLTYHGISFPCMESGDS